MKNRCEYIMRDTISEELLEYFKIAMNTNHSHVKILWGNLRGQFKVTHDTLTVLETTNKNKAIEIYNDIPITL